MQKTGSTEGEAYSSNDIMHEKRWTEKCTTGVYIYNSGEENTMKEGCEQVFIPIICNKYV